MIGLFEALNRQHAVSALFAEATGWLRKSGAGMIVGPIDGDTWHSYRLNVGPFDAEPFLMEPYNPNYYPRLWEENGFNPLERYYSLQVSDVAGAASRLEKSYHAAEENGYRFENLRTDRFEQELQRFYDLSCTIFAGNFLYSPIALDDFLELYMAARPLVDPDLVTFAVAPDGSDAGFLFAFPDRIRAVRAMRGSRSLLAKLRFFRFRDRVERINLKSLGVLPAHRRAGLGAALMYSGYSAALCKSIDVVNLCLILEGNPSGRLEGGLGRLLRRYHLYKWECADTDDPEP
jgi:GNAT superfamily N-acetyltransferase